MVFLGDIEQVDFDQEKKRKQSALQHIIDIFKDKAKAQEVADDLRHKMMNDPNVDDDSTDYFVEGYSVN